jgi:hypothetical protein
VAGKYEGELRAFATAKKPNGRSPLSVALVVTQHASVGLSDRIGIFEIEQFVALNLYVVETDPSLKIDLSR